MPVPVTGTASVGVGPPQATIVYVFDASGSTGNAGGACGTVLACEQTFFTGLNTAAGASGAVNHIGLVVFGNDAVKADMTPGGGDDQLGVSADGNTVVNSISLFNSGFNYNVAQYTSKNGDADGTNYAAALQQALAELTASTDSKKFLIFASDGLSNAGTLSDFNAALTAIAGTGTVANSFAVGASSACTGGTTGNLADITVNGGQCFAVPNPNDLPNIIPNFIGSTLTSLTMSVDGGPQTPVATTPALPQPGPATVTYSTMTAGLNPGSHVICVTANATDVTGGSASTTTCVTVKVYDLLLTPATATNDLSTDQHAHRHRDTPRARRLGRRLPRRRSRSAGTTRALGTCAPVTCLTDATGHVTFTYSVPVSPSSIGTDSITATVTLANPTGATDSEVVAKQWGDATPPTAACTPTTNPLGRQHSAGGHQSEERPESRTVSICSAEPTPSTRARRSRSATRRAASSPGRTRAARRSSSCRHRAGRRT